MDWSLDTGSIPVGSTKKQKGTHLVSLFVFLFGGVSELNTLVPTALELHPGFPSLQVTRPHARIGFTYQTEP